MKKMMSIGIICATVLALVSILLSIGHFRQGLEERYTEDMYGRLSELSVNNAASIYAKVSDQFEMMHALALYLADEDLHGERVLSMMNQTVTSFQFLRCAITFPDGSSITHDSKNNADTSMDEHVIKGFQGISSVTGPRGAVVDPSKTVILLTVPIYRNEQVIALLTCTYETKYLEKVFQMTNFSGQGYSYIIGADGSIISKPAMDGLIYDGDNMLSFVSQQNEETFSTMAQNMKAMQSGSMVFHTDGHRKYVSYQPLGINEWYVFSVTSGEVLDSQLDGMLGSVFTLSISITVTLIVLIFLVWLYIYLLERRSKKELSQLAYYDALTGLPNRNLFEKEARRILDSAQGNYSYIILNVNKFKLINDIFGFAQGDAFLRHIAATLRREAGKDEVCARFDTDNFHILSIFTSKEDLEKRMLSVATRISAYHFEKNIPHKLSVGFGAYFIEDKRMPISPMGDKARMALSKIKGIHAPVTNFYNTEITTQFMAEQEIENTMQGALANGEMKLFLQPKCFAESHQVHSAEALVRWQSPEKGTIMPDSFIPLFEKNGFIIQLDMYMVETACRQLREWQERRMQVYPISVNQSRSCLYQPNYVKALMSILDKYAISPSLIELEVTERAFFEDESALIRIIEQLHSFGFKVAMDDFGAGYSSLNMLQDVLVDVLKIDKNFFRESIHSERGKKIVSNIVTMANDLNIEVVAEGIETQEQLDFLNEIHCGSVQGYYFSKPLPASAFEEIYCNKQTPVL